MEHLYHGYKWSSTQHSSQVILRPTSNHHQMECPCCSTCFCFMVSFFTADVYVPVPSMIITEKKTRLLARIRVVCPFLQLETPIFFCFSNEQIGHSISQLNHILVGGFNPSEKYESQLGWLFPIYGKIKIMFQTTNQHFFLLESSQFMSNPKKKHAAWIAQVSLGGPMACFMQRFDRWEPVDRSPRDTADAKWKIIDIHHLQEVLPPMWQRWFMGYPLVN